MLSQKQEKGSAKIFFGEWTRAKIYFMGENYMS